MATKTISIMDDVYETLKSLKAPHESFSDEIRRLIKTKGSILDFAGKWGDISDAEANRMEEAMMKTRTGTRVKELLEK